MRSLHASAVAAIAGVSMLPLSIDSVSAFTLPGDTAAISIAGVQIETVYFRGVARGGVHRGYGVHGGGFHGGYGYHRGYGYGAGVGAAVLGGAAVGAAVLSRRCWTNSYGAQVCN
jgi:hypothetical protein